MGWKTLVNKVDYWLGLRAARKAKEAHRADGGDTPHGAGLPLSVRWERVASFERESYKVSSIHPLEGGKVLVGCYNSVERGTSRLHVVGADGSRKEIWKGGEETIGQGWKGGGQWWLPVEKKAGNIIGVPLDGSSASAATAQGGQYSCRIVDAHVAVGNKLFQIGDTETPRAQLSKLGGIISGLVYADGEWIGSDDERGIEGERGWFISALCPELAFVGGKVLAFLRSGEVRVIEDGQLGQSIGNTIRKCRRAWTENGLCWWTTAPSDGDGKHGCWVTDGTSMLKVGEFPGKAEATQAGALGSLFGSAVCIGTDGAVWVAVADETQNGYHVWRGIPSWPKPEPEPTPEPTPDPEPTPAPQVEEVVETSKPAVWNEASQADDYGMGGDVFARTGMVAGRTWRLLHGLYDEMPADPAAWVDQAMREGAKGIVVDVEGPFNGVPAMRTIRSACNAAGARLVGAVKVSCEPGGSYLAGDFDGSVKFCQEVFDAVGIWGYGCDGAGYEAWISKWRSCGYTKQIGVFQDQVRDSGGYRGKEVWKDVAKHAKAGGYPFYLFLPNHSSSADLAALKEIFA